MKMWKKTLAMLMCASMAVGSFAGCFGGGGDSSSNDSSSDSTPPTPPAPSAEELATEAAEAYVNNAITALEGAKSCKIVINMNNKDVTDYFGEDGETIDPELQETDTDNTVTEIVIAQEGEGIALQVTSTSAYSYDGDETVYTDVEETIITNGMQYARSYWYDSEMTADEITEAKAEKWAKSNVNIEGTEALPVELIEKLLDTKEVEDAYNMLITELKGSLKDKILAEEAADGNFVWEYDFADDVNGILAFIEGVDETKDTLGKVINDVLAEVAPGLTAEALLGQLKAYSKMTLADALTNVDTMLSQYGTTLQSLKDAIVNSEFVGVLMSDEAAMGLTAEEIAKVKAWQFASLKEGEMGEAIVGDLINNLLLENGIVEAPAEGEEPVDYVADYLAMAEASLDMTLEELDITMPDVAGNVANKLEGTYGVSFDTTTQTLDAINFSFDAELVSYEGEYNGETGVYDIVVGYCTQYIDLDVTVSEISATISAPAEDDIIDCLFLNSWYSNDENLYLDSDEYGVGGDFYVCDENGELLYYISFSGDVMTDYGVTVNITENDAGGWGDIPQSEVSAYFENNVLEFTITINADGTYVVEGIPTIQEMVDWYNNEYTA